MSVAEAPVRPIFGQITIDDMRKNELLTRTVLPLLKEACKHTKGRFTVDVVVEGLTRGMFGLWGVMRPPASLDAVLVTCPAGEVFDILALGPNFEDAFLFLGPLGGAARTAGCKRMRMTGPGFWRKHLPMGDDGWKIAAMIYERDL